VTRRFVGPGWLIFAVAFLARQLNATLLSHSPAAHVLTGDSLVYHAWAQRIAAGDWLGDEVFYQAPLYPYTLGVVMRLLGDGVPALRFAGAVLGALGCLLLALAARRLFGGETNRAGHVASLCAGLGLALYPPALFHDGLIQKTVLDTLLVCAMLWALAGVLVAPRARRLLGLGASVGLLALSRENALLFVPVLLAWLLLWRAPPPPLPGRWARLLPFAAGLALVLAPVALRNLVVGGELHLTTSQFGPNFYIGNAAGADGFYHPLRTGRGNALFERDDAEAIAEEAAGHALSPGEVSDWWRDRALADIRAAPAAWGRLLLRKAALALNRTEIQDGEDLETLAAWSWPLAGAAVLDFGMLAPLGGLGLVLAWRRRRGLLPVLLLAVTYFASLMPFFLMGRYRHPLVPFLVLFAAGLALAFEPVSAADERAPAGAAPARRDGWRAAWRPAVGFAVAGLLWVVCRQPLVDIPAQRLTTHANLAFGLQQLGALDEAVDEYRAALRLDGDDVEVLNNLGTALLAQHDASSAVKQFARAVELRPDYAGAWLNLGVAYGALADDERAIGALKRAVSLDERLPLAQLQLGLAWQRSGKPVRAAASLQRAVELDPGLAEGWLALGQMFERSGDRDAARAAYRKLLELRPAHAQATEALAALGSEP